MLSAIYHLISFSFESLKPPNKSNKNQEGVHITVLHCQCPTVVFFSFFKEPIKLNKVRIMFIIYLLCYNKVLFLTFLFLPMAPLFFQSFMLENQACIFSLQIACIIKYHLLCTGLQFYFITAINLLKSLLTSHFVFYKKS